MRIVSENTDQELTVARARDAMVWPLRELAANLMRVVRGAGKPHAIGQQAVAVINALNAYHDAAGAYPSSDEITRALRLDWDEARAERFAADPWTGAERLMVRGCLQIAASELLLQPMQSRAGGTEMFEGLTVIEDIRAQNRKSRSKAPQARALRQRRPRSNP